jgi:hypothetical protein
VSGISQIRTDLKAFRAVAESGVEVPDWALNAIWRWFFDQELRLPLPVMPLSSEERRDLSLEILDEMDSRFVALEKAADTMSPEEQSDLNTSEDGMKANALWRELAGCYAHVINQSVVVLSEEEAEMAYSHIIPTLMATVGISEEELYDRIRNDGSTRMMLRRSGIDPDKLLGN